ncbi:multi-sensor hybrid histidine kinase [Candidatus Magnetoovum chiemensis]|nr:multi-sensor hybrid histidine kinase [Candidatus Magnetoovum chiemensis]
MRIYPKTSIILLFISLAPILAVSVSSYYIAEMLFAENLEAKLESIAKLKKDRVTAKRDRNKERINLITSRPPMRVALENYMKTGDKSQQDIAITALLGAKTVIKDIIDVSVLNQEGKVIASTNRSLHGKDLSKEEYFIRGKEGYSLDVLSLDSQNRVINYISSPLVHEGRLIGVMAVESAFEQIENIITDYYGLGETGEAILSKRDKNGDALFIVSPRFAPDSALKKTIPKNSTSTPMIQALSKKEIVMDDAIDYRGKAVVAATKHIAEADWGLVVKIDRDEAFAELSQLRNLFIKIAILTIILTLLLSSFVARSITKPIVRLTNAAKKIKEGDTSNLPDIKSTDEIGFLSQTLNEMTMNLLEAKRKLERSIEEQYKLFFENAVEAIFLFEAREENSGVIIQANRAASNTYGYTIDELQGMCIRSLSAPDEEENDEDIISRILSGQWVKGETVDMKKNGRTFYIEYTAGLLEIKDKKYIIKFVNDISRRKELEEAQETARRQAETANKTKSEFIANISHEIRTPMNAIIGLSGLALNTNLTEKQKDYLNNILSSAKSLLGIINDVLDLSKIESNKLDLEAINFNLDDLLNDIATIHALKAHEKGIELVYSIGGSIPRLLIGDPLRLGQIVTNLLNNAIKFTEKGEVILSIQALNITEEDVVLEFLVKDTGVGIKPEKLSSLFKPFSQGDSSITRTYGGTGLGLTICKNLTEKMQGEINVKSEYGKGSEFKFTVKLECQRPCRTQRYTLPSEARKLKALVVDDNKTSRQILKSILEGFSFNVTTVECGKEAIEELKSTAANKQQQQYQIILMDWKMPEIDGLETIHLIKENSELINIPTIIMVTAHDSEELREAAKNLGVKLCLPKPIHPSALYNAIIELFGRLECAQIKKDETEKAVTENFEDIKGAKIFLVEDHRINREIVIELLELIAVKVDVATNGLEALSALEHNGNIYDLILMDLQMPEMDGFQATAQIRKTMTKDDLPIIAMTAHAMKDEIDKCLSTGMNDYISKPFEVDTFYETIRKWIKKTDRNINTKKAPDYDDALPDELDGIDLDALLKRLRGNRKLLKMIVIEFQAASKEITEDLSNAAASNDYNKAKDLLHGLKGISANISAADLYNEIARLENTIAASEPIELDNLYAQLNRIHNSAAVLENLQTNKPVLKPSEVMSDDNDLSSMLSQLNKLLDENALSAITYIERIKHKIEAVFGAETANKLYENINSLNYSEAVSLLNYAMNKLNLTQR